MFANLEYRARERERKRESRRHAAKLNEKKGDRDLQREIKNKGDIFWLEEQHENFLQLRLQNEKCYRPPIKCKVKMSGSEKSERECRGKKQVMLNLIIL